ncbi:MAG TPA: hypothetical protein VH912_24200 [Streptosporangiaceae bacterium]|jgi:hypothetical protein
MKGKHQQIAGPRRVNDELEGQIATYQHAVARLTRERDEARAALAKHDQGHRRIERELRARLSEGVSPEVGALRRANAKLQREIDVRRQVTTRLGYQQSAGRMVLFAALRDAGIETFDAASIVVDTFPMWAAAHKSDWFVGSYHEADYEGDNDAVRKQAARVDTRNRQAQIASLVGALNKISTQLYKRIIHGDSDALREALFLAAARGDALITGDQE